MDIVQKKQEVLESIANQPLNVVYIRVDICNQVQLADLLKEDFYDDRDYFEEGIISVHFGRFSAQWDKNNLKFYPIWKEYNDKF